MVLWSSEKIDKKILEFTSADDIEIEKILLPYVKKALELHAKNLNANSILSDEELAKAIDIINNANVKITSNNEDSHTALIEFITRKDKILANKLRTYKSRNEEIAVAETYYFVQKLNDIDSLLEKIINKFNSLASKHEKTNWIGFTHTRIATKAKAADWLNSYSYMLSLIRSMIVHVKKIMRNVALGSGPGFGSELKIFHVNGLKNVENPQLMQHLRIYKHMMVIEMCFNISFILSKFASDIIFYSSDNNGHVCLDKRIAQGSSAMPHKMNPDVFEILRANHSKFEGFLLLSSNTSNLISGYHRDYQVSKEAAVKAITLIEKELQIIHIVLDRIYLNVKKIDKDIKNNFKLLSYENLSNEAKKGKDVKRLYHKYRY
ncbi:MAG: lyase family protein [Candidatus Micrarchaeota archaeon]|nr:lyase family protein [Candidatus Micrarchaeota archaeon]